MMQFKFCTSHVHAYFMHMLFHFLSSLYLVVIVFLSLSMSISWIDCAMAPKRRSTLGRNPFQGFSSSSSSDPIPPLHVWFCDGKA